MATVVSLQRAINVGRGRAVPMAELRAVYESLGCRNVQTVLQSGNVVCDTSLASAVLARQAEAALTARFGFAIPVINRTATELRRTVERNPFPHEAKAEPARLVVVFLPAPPTPAEREALAKPIDGPERLKLVAADLYVHYAAGIGRSKLKLPLSTPGTARNWTTILRLLALAEDTANSQAHRRKVESAAPESAATGQHGEDAMAKGQQKPNKEKRKPKADKNKPKKGAPAASPMAMSSSSSSGGGKK